MNKELSLIKLPNFFALKGYESDLEESKAKIITEKKNELVSQLKKRDAPSPTSSETKQSDMDDLVEINKGGEDEDYDPVERTEMMYDDCQKVYYQDVRRC